MKTCTARHLLLLVAGIMPAVFFVPCARAEVPIFYYGYTRLTPLAQGSFVHWLSGEYERQTETVAGQIWEGDGHNHTVNYYDTFRAFAVFEVPRFKGIVTREDIGIPDGIFPDVTTLRTKVFAAHLDFQHIWEDELGQDHNPLEVRMAALPASSLIDGTLGPEDAFNALLSGPRVELSGIHASDTPQLHLLNKQFLDLLRHTDGEQIVFSFTMDLYDHRGTLDLKYPDPGMELYVDYDGYAPLSPVPEPATYAGIGAALCSLLAIRRTFSARRASAT